MPMCLVNFAGDWIQLAPPVYLRLRNIDGLINELSDIVIPKNPKIGTQLTTQRIDRRLLV